MGPAKFHIRAIFVFLIRFLASTGRLDNKNVSFVQIWVLWPVLHGTESYRHFQVQTLGKPVGPAKSHIRAIFVFLIRFIASTGRLDNKNVSFVQIWVL